MNYFVERKVGKICSLYRQAQEGVPPEELAEDHPEVVAFLNPPPPTQNELEQQLRDRFAFDKVFRAKCISDLAFRLGKAPGALTAPELAAERDRIAAIFKAL